MQAQAGIHRQIPVESRPDMCAEALPHGLLVPGPYKGRQPICDERMAHAFILLSPSLPLFLIQNASCT